MSAVGECASGILAATQEMTGESEEALSRFTDVAAVVEQASAAAEGMSASAAEVAASVQSVASSSAQQEASVDKLAASSRELSAVAQELAETAAFFRVEDPAPAKAPAALSLRLKAA